VPFYVDPQKVITLPLKETGPATGEFEAMFPMELRYDQRTFTVKYDSNEVTVELLNLPQAFIKIGDKEYTVDLVQKHEEKVLEIIPQKFRLGARCSLALIEGLRKSSRLRWSSGTGTWGKTLLISRSPMPSLMSTFFG